MPFNSKPSPKTLLDRATSMDTPQTGTSSLGRGDVGIRGWGRSGVFMANSLCPRLPEVARAPRGTMSARDTRNNAKFRKMRPVPSRESSLRNLAIARTKWRPPRAWRSLQETRVIKRLVYQWSNTREPGKWSGRAVARWLRVSHTYIQKLVREFAQNPSEIQRRRIAKVRQRSST
jgi:hypothetical protein